MAKTIVCHCEDITLDELHSALAQGYREIESLKRFTGIATGKCQGKCCLIQTLREIDSPRGTDSIRRGLDQGPGEPPQRWGGEDFARLIRLPTIRQPVTPLAVDDIVECSAPLEAGKDDAT